MRYPIGTRILSSCGQRLQVVKQGKYFQFYPNRIFYPSLKDWTQTLEKNSTLETFLPLHVTPKQRQVLDIENSLAFDRHSTIAQKLEYLFRSLNIRSQVNYTVPSSFRMTTKWYTCGVWYDQDFYSFLKVLGHYKHFYTGTQVEILDTSSKWIHVAPCKDMVYVRGILTNNLAKYALVRNKVYRLRVQWKAGRKRFSQEFDMDVF